MRRNVRRGVRRSGSGRNIGRSGVRYLWMKNVVLWTKSALMDEKRHFMDQICTLWMRIAFMDEKRRFMDQICTLWTRFALMDEKRIFYGKKNTSHSSAGFAIPIPTLPFDNILILSVVESVV